jgi:two-component system LytT family response regulator
MKIDSIIIDQEQETASYLRKCLHTNFPGLHVHGEASNSTEANQLIKASNPGLIFLDIDTVRKNSSDLREYSAAGVELVFLSYRPEDAVHAIQQGACGFLLKPFNISDIVLSIGNTIRRLNQRFAVPASQPPEFGSASQRPIGIPTMEGIEFLNTSEIIRCEGLQKCTRIVTTRRSSLVSSYCIGEFRKLLDTDNFFACHKSHLINLMYVRKLTREGFIIMVDNVSVPLARRKRIEFLENVRHL